MAEFGKEILSAKVYTLPREEWRGWLGRREAIYKREMRRIQKENGGVLGLVAEAMLGIIGPADRILIRQIEEGKIERPRSWMEIDWRAAKKIVKETEAEVWDRLAGIHPAYGAVALGLAKLAESRNEKDFAGLERLFVWAAWELRKAGLPIVLGLGDDWGNNSGTKGRLQVEPDIVVGLPDCESKLDVRLISLMKSLKKEYPKNIWQQRKLLLIWKFGVGFQVLSATSGINLPEAMMQTVNLQKNVQMVESVWRMAGVENEGEAVDYLNADSAAHELGHGVFELDALRAELGPDALGARKCLEMIVQGRKGWKGMEQEKMVLTILGECAAWGREKMTGHGNADGYPYSGRRMVNLMFDVGVVKFEGERLVVNLAKLDKYTKELKSVEKRVMTRKGRRKMKSLGRLRADAKRLIDLAD